MMKIKLLKESTEILERLKDTKKVKLGGRILELGSVAPGICKKGAAMLFNHMIYVLEWDTDGETIIAGEAMQARGTPAYNRFPSNLSFVDITDFVYVTLQNKNSNEDQNDEDED